MTASPWIARLSAASSLCAPLVIASFLLAEEAAEAQPVPAPEDLSGPPVVTARAWAVADGESGEILAGEEAETPTKAASTTKVMTCLVASGVREGRRIYVVVIGSAGNEARYADVRNLFRWAWSQ